MCWTVDEIVSLQKSGRFNLMSKVWYIALSSFFWKKLYSVSVVDIQFFNWMLGVSVSVLCYGCITTFEATYRLCMCTLWIQVK